MSPQEITIRNAAIADFMGWERLGDDKIYMVPNLYPIETNTGETSMHSSSMGFDCSIDWLVPVIKKLSDLPPSMKTNSDEDLRLFRLCNQLSELKVVQGVEVVYAKVYEAVSFYLKLKERYSL